MTQRIIILTLLAVAALGSTWLMNRMGQQTAATATGESRVPDYYMEDFSTLSMREDGTPKDKLKALYMAHYPDDDTTELLQPEMEVYRRHDTPLYIRAEKGWVTANNEVILLKGKVKMWENDESGKRTLEVDTSNVRVLMHEEYAETDDYTTINSTRATITGTGMRAYFKDSRLKVIKHERTVIEPKHDAS